MSSIKNKSVKIVIGETTFRSSYADSNALWRVIGKKSKDCFLCEIANEVFEFEGKTYDGDYAGIQKVFLKSEIQQAVGWQEFWNDVHADHENFYKDLKVGQIVHYHNGFGAYVRCEVVESKKLKPVALLGNWHSHELPRRLPTGDIMDTYWSKQIKEGELLKPNGTHIWEFYRIGKNKKPTNMIDDPTVMEPINLELPEMTQDQKRNADLWATVNEIREIVDSSSNDPQQIIDSVVGFLKARSL
jgi:hypothetical protein